MVSLYAIAAAARAVAGDVLIDDVAVQRPVVVMVVLGFLVPEAVAEQAREARAGRDGARAAREELAQADEEDE